jgi:alkylation response protein AidB-like acyl-CoA dehydrogenase
MSPDPLRYQCFDDQQAAVAEAAELTFASSTPRVDEGWSAISIPEELGGSGGGAAELAAVVEALGATTSDSPLAWTLAVFAAVLLQADHRPDTLLADVAKGLLTASIPISPNADEGLLLVRPSTDGRITGSFLALGALRATLALPVLADGTEALALVHPDQDGVAATAVTGMDASRPWTKYDLGEARLSREFLYPLSGLTAKLHRALGIYAALDAVGAARKALERTLSYARVREQFGRPLGSFQAYKHACSTAFIDLKLAQSVSFRAATTPGDEGLRYALASAVDATASATRVCMTAIQLHGGIGFSAESGLDRYLRRSRADELIVGRRHSLRALVRTLSAVTTANYEEERA